MAFIGQGGVVTTFPNTGEKLCVGCDYWKGPREIGYNGTAAISKGKEPALCVMKKGNTYPNAPCSCNTISFKAWSYLK